MEHAQLSYSGHWHFVNSTCDIVDPLAMALLGGSIR